MKRIGEQKVREIVKNGGYVVFREFYMLNSGYRVYDSNDKMLGYITYDLAYRLFTEEFLVVKSHTYSSTTYVYNKPSENYVVIIYKCDSAENLTIVSKEYYDDINIARNRMTEINEGCPEYKNCLAALTNQ